MKKILAILTTVIIGFVLTGCGKGSDYEIDYVCSKDFDGSTLRVLNWGEYMDEELVDTFEDLCNVKVIYEEADSNETMRTRLDAANYDVLFPSEYMIENLINADLLAKIDFNNVPNFHYIDEQYLNKTHNLTHDMDNEYSVPYFWGTVGIMYNKEFLEELNIEEAEMNTWEILKDSRLDGKMMMYDSQRDVFMIGLKLLGYSVNLEADDSTQDFKDKIDEARLALADIHDNTRNYETDQIKAYIQEADIAVGVVYSGDYLDTVFELGDDATDQIGYVVPEEGSNMWIDGMVIPKKATNKALAEEFINFLLDPQVAYYNAAYVGYSTPHTAALEKLKVDEDYMDLVKLDAYLPKEETLSRTEVYRDLGVELNDYMYEAFLELK